MSSRLSAPVSSKWRPKPEMTRHPRSMPAGLKNDVNSMRSVELNNNGLIQKQTKIRMLNTRLSCFELTSSPDQSVVINRTYSGFHSFQIYRWREKKTRYSRVKSPSQQSLGISRKTPWESAAWHAKRRLRKRLATHNHFQHHFLTPLPQSTTA